MLWHIDSFYYQQPFNLTSLRSSILKAINFNFTCKQGLKCCESLFISRALPYSVFMCHPWQQYLEHLKLERLLGYSVLVGLAIKRAHKYLKRVGFTDQSMGRCTKAKGTIFPGYFVKNHAFSLILNVHRQGITYKESILCNLIFNCKLN